MDVRIVNVDFYMHSPIPNLDPVYSEFRGSSVQQVPVLRIFGSNGDGMKTCLHVHGVFPYIYIPYDGENSIDAVVYQLATSLDKAINISLGQTSSNVQHIFKILLVSGIPFYGYHAKHHQFLKIYFYNPLIVKKACTLLDNGNIMGKIFQPHEAHIPYVLQFMIDYNLYGMSFVNISDVKYRGNPTVTVLEELILPPTIQRMSTCKLEVDALADHILNRSEVNSQNLGLNPGIQALWNDEKQRRINAGDSSLVEHCLTQNRVDIKPTATHLTFFNVLKEKLEKPVKIEENKNQNLSVYPAETPRDNARDKIINASLIESHITGSQSSDSTFLDFTITPEDNEQDITLDNDALQLLEVLNDLRENIESDSILSQAVPEQDSDIEQTDEDMSLPLQYVQTPPKTDPQKLNATLEELADSYFDISINIPQLDGCDDIIPTLRKSTRLRKNCEKSRPGQMSKENGETSLINEECSHDNHRNYEKNEFNEKSSVVEHLKSNSLKAISSAFTTHTGLSSNLLEDEDATKLSYMLCHLHQDPSTIESETSSVSQLQADILNLVSRAENQFKSASNNIENLKLNLTRSDINTELASCKKINSGFKHTNLGDKKATSKVRKCIKYVGCSKEVQLSISKYDMKCLEIPETQTEISATKSKDYNFSEQSIVKSLTCEKTNSNDTKTTLRKGKIFNFVESSQKQSKLNKCNKQNNILNITNEKQVEFDVLAVKLEDSVLNSQHVFKGDRNVDESLSSNSNINITKKSKRKNLDPQDLKLEFDQNGVFVDKTSSTEFEQDNNDKLVLPKPEDVSAIPLTPTIALNMSLSELDLNNEDKLKKEDLTESVKFVDTCQRVTKHKANEVKNSFSDSSEEEEYNKDEPLVGCYKTDANSNLRCHTRIEDTKENELSGLRNLSLNESSSQELVAINGEDKKCSRIIDNVKQKCNVNELRTHTKTRKRKSSIKSTLGLLSNNETEKIRHGNTVELLDLSDNTKTELNPTSLHVPISMQIPKLSNKDCNENHIEQNYVSKSKKTARSRKRKASLCENVENKLKKMENVTTDFKQPKLKRKESPLYEKVSLDDIIINDIQITRNKHATDSSKIDYCAANLIQHPSENNHTLVHSNDNNLSSKTNKIGNIPTVISKDIMCETFKNKKKVNQSKYRKSPKRLNSNVKKSKMKSDDSHLDMSTIYSKGLTSNVPIESNLILKQPTKEKDIKYKISERDTKHESNHKIFHGRKTNIELGDITNITYDKAKSNTTSLNHVNRTKSKNKQDNTVGIERKKIISNSLPFEIDTNVENEADDISIVSNVNLSMSRVDCNLYQPSKFTAKVSTDNTKTTECLLTRKEQNKRVIKDIDIFKFGDIILNEPAKKKNVKKRQKMKNHEHYETNALNISGDKRILKNSSTIEKKKRKVVKRELLEPPSCSNSKKVKNYFNQTIITTPHEHSVPVLVQVPLLDDTFHKSPSLCRKTRKGTSVIFPERFKNPKFTVVPANNRPYYYSPKEPRDLVVTSLETYKLATNFPNTKWRTTEHSPSKQIKVLSCVVLEGEERIDINTLSLGQTVSLNHSSLFPEECNYSMQFFSDFKRSVQEEFEQSYEENRCLKGTEIHFNGQHEDVNKADDHNNKVIENDIHKQIKQQQNLRKTVEVKFNDALNLDDLFTNLLQKIEKRISEIFKDIDEVKENSTVSFSKMLAKRKSVTELPIYTYPNIKIKEKIQLLQNTNKICDIGCTKEVSLKKPVPKQHFFNANIADKSGDISTEDVFTKENIFHNHISKQTRLDVTSKKEKESKSGIYDFVKMEPLKYVNKQKMQQVNDFKNVNRYDEFIKRNLFGFATKKDVDERDILKTRMQVRSYTFGGGPHCCGSILNGCSNSSASNFPIGENKFGLADNTAIRYPLNQYNYLDGTHDSTSSDEEAKIPKTTKKRKLCATQPTSKYMPLNVRYVSPTKNATSRIQTQDNNSKIRVMSQQPPNVMQKHRRKLSFSQIHQFNSTHVQEKISCQFTKQKCTKTSEKIYIDCSSTNSENSANSNEEILPFQVCEASLHCDNNTEERLCSSVKEDDVIKKTAELVEKDRLTAKKGTILREGGNQICEDDQIILNNKTPFDLDKTLTPSCRSSDSSSLFSDDLFLPDSEENKNINRTNPAEKYDIERKFIPVPGSSKMDPQFCRLSQVTQNSSSDDILTPYQKENNSRLNARPETVSYSSENNKQITLEKPDKNETLSSLHITTSSANEIISGNFDYQAISKQCKEAIIITPKVQPPSKEEVENTLETYNIPQVRFQEPFYSDRKDVTGNIEVGKSVLKIPSNNVMDLPQFNTSFTGIEYHKKKMLEVFEFDNKKLSAEQIRQYKLSTSKNVRIIVTPGRLPPSRKEVEEWIKEQKKKKTAETSNEQKQKKTRIFLPNSPGRDGDESFDSLTLSPCTPIDANATVCRLDTKSEGHSDNLEEDRASNSELNASNVDQFKIDASPTLKNKSGYGVRKHKTRIKQVKESLLSKRHHHDSELINKTVGDVSDTNFTSNCEIKDDTDNNKSEDLHVKISSMSDVSSSNDTIINKLSKNSSTNSHQITGPTLERTNNFLMPSHDLNQAKAIKEHLHLTILSIEVVVITRNEYKPNPELDQIKAIIFTLYCNENVSHGGFIINSLPDSPSKIKVSILNGIDAKYNLKGVTSELELINEFVEFVKNSDPDILVGFEIQMLSWGFLIDRGYVLGLNLTILLSRTPHVIKKSKSEDDQDLVITGRILIDFWRLLRHEIALTSYTFENVVYHILHRRIPLFSHKDFTNWLQHPTSLYRNRVIEYHSFKTSAILQIMDQLDLIGRTSELAKLFGIQFYEVLSRGSQFRVESMMLRLAKPLNFIPVSPNQQQRARMRAPESLPLIMEPESKFYTDPVIVLDFQSLYPSMMIAYNYCFSTCLGRIEHLGGNLPFEFGATQLKVSRRYLQYFIKKEKLNISPCGIAFVNKSIRLGILPRMLQEILDTRLMVKKSLKENVGNKVLERVLDARQLGLKLIANVTYGYTAANFSGRMPCIELGDSVVSKGRETLQRAINLVEKTPQWGAKVVYGDTDSLFVLIPGKSKETAFKIGAEIAEAVTNDNPSPVKLKLEKIFQPCILQTKKRYVGYMYESPNQKEPEFLAKGIETVRRDGCPAAAKMLEKCLKLLFDTRDVSLIKKYVTRQFSKLLIGRVSLQDLTFAKEYRGSSNYRPGACVPALELARKWTSIDKRNEPRKGERVPYIIINGPPGQPLIKLVRSPRDLLNDPSLRPNAIYYITKAIIPPINRCFLLIGADLNQWFNEMPRKQYQYLPSSPGKNKTRKNTITQFFSTLDCAICGTLTQDGICVKCRSKPQESSVLLHEKMRLWEQNYHDSLLICQSCCGRQDEITCISLDCPLYYRRTQTERDLQQSEFIRQLVATLPSMEF